MGIDLATWRARIGLNYYHMCRPLQTRWRSSCGRLYQPGVVSWGVGEVMNDTPLVLKSCMTIVTLTLILQYVVCFWYKLKGRGGGGKVCCHWEWSPLQVKRIVYDEGTLLLRAIVVVIPLLLVIAGDVERNPGPEVSNLGLLLHALHPVRVSWYNIGLELGIPYTELECFKTNFPDLSDSMREMLKHWLDIAVDPRPTWESVVTALRSPTVGKSRVAEELESKYCTQHKKGELNTISNNMNEEAHHQATVETQIEGQARQCNTCSAPDLESPTTSTTSSTRQSSSTSPPPNEGSHKPPFGCGCGNCTLSSFIERGCLHPISSENTFPYLDLSGLTDEKKEELRERLRFESRQIMMEFQKLVSATIESLIRRDIPLKRLVSHVMTLGTFEPVFKEAKDIRLLQDHITELKTAASIPDVFLILQDYFSFFNYDIIEHIVEVIGTEEDKAKLQKYKDKFDEYVKRRIFECGPCFGPESETDHPNISLKLDSRYDSYTVAEIKSFCRRMSEILQVSLKGVLRLCRIEKGCISLTLQVPSFVQQKIFPLSREKETILKTEGVLQLKCGKYQFPRLAEVSHHEIDASVDEAENFEPAQKKPRLEIDTEHDGEEVDVIKLEAARKAQHGFDRDSAMGLSVFTGGKSTTLSDDPLDRVLEEPDYELRVQDITDSESPTTAAARHSGNTTSFPSEISQKSSWVVGETEEKYCVPEEQSTRTSFPYLNLSALTHEKQQELRGRLQSESQQIIIQFQELVSSTIDSFERRGIPLVRLVSHVMTLGVFNPVCKEPQVPVFRDYFEELKVAKTIPKVFLVLGDCFSFFNYDIIEHIIEGLGTEKDKAGLQSYKEDFNQYAKRRIFECPPEYGPVSDTKHATLVVKLDASYDDYTVAAIEKFRWRLSDTLHLSPKGVLCLCRVEEGCIQLTFKVPSFVTQQILPLSSEQNKALAAMDVMKLTWGEYQFRHDDDSGMTPQIEADDVDELEAAWMKLQLDTDTESDIEEFKMCEPVEGCKTYEPIEELKVYEPVREKCDMHRRDAFSELSLPISVN